MVGYETILDELRSHDISVVAASVDPQDKAAEVAANLSFPVGHSVSRADAASLGSWWEERRQIIQPSEFILNAERRVIASSYSDGPVGLVDAADVVKSVKFYISQMKK